MREDHRLRSEDTDCLKVSGLVEKQDGGDCQIGWRCLGDLEIDDLCVKLCEIFGKVRFDAVVAFRKDEVVDLGWSAMLQWGWAVRAADHHVS